MMANTPTPYTVIIDTREQRPFDFAAPLRVARHRRTYSVLTARGTLPSGDYSLLGCESRVAVERKSLSDLFGTIASGRDRFERELARLNAFSHAAVVVEAEWSTIFQAPPARSRLPPRTIFLSVVSWQQRYPLVHWWFLPSRSVAEATTIRILDKFWREQHDARPTARARSPQPFKDAPLCPTASSTTAPSIPAPFAAGCPIAGPTQ